MDKYKKKSLNFMGFSRDLRKLDRDHRRCASRLQRLSTFRAVEDENTKEMKESGSKIPAMGKPQVASRLEMLQKWKQEKIIKKQQESRLKKPVFKVGVSKPQTLFALDTSSGLSKSSFHVSNSQLYGKKAENHIRSNIKTTIKVPNSQPSKKPEVAMNSLKTSTKDLKVPSKSKIVVANKPEIKSIKNKESGIQSLTMKPKVDIAKKVTTKESTLQPLSTRLKVIPTRVPSIKSSIPSSSLPKPTISRTLNKFQTSIPKTNRSKIPGEKSNDKNFHDKKATSIPKFPRTTASQHRGNISEKSGKSETKVPTKPVEDSPTFECNISHIEPVREQKKSFAPQGFKFQPPAELNSSLFLEDGPSAIFMRMRNRILRTSTPKQSSSSKESSPEIKDAECLEKEKSQLTKNASKDIEPLNKHNIEAASSPLLESVSLNDIKPINCKQSLKFEFPEADSTQDQKDLVFSFESIYPDSDTIKIKTTDAHSNFAIHSSKIGPSDFSLGAKPEPIDTINLHNSEASETKSVGIGPSGAVDPPVFSDLVKSDKTAALEDIFLSSNIAHPELALNTEPDPAASINSPFLLGSVALKKNSSDVGLTKVVDTSILSDFEKTVKMEANSNNTNLADGCNDTALFPGDNALVGDKAVLDEKNKYSNGFLQKLENDNKIPLKTRNFQRREKPVLMSINESLENTPKSAIKKKFPESSFTPRRSLRLAKLSGNFSSLDNLLDSPKPKLQGKTCGKEGFTPRRSTRLSKFSIEFNSDENLFNVGRPTLFESPEDRRLPKLVSKVTYDFDRLSMEKEEDTQFQAANYGKVSLLPMTRTSVMKGPVRENLMSFSPDV